MLYYTCFILSVWIFGIAETEIARGSPLGTTTEVQRVGFHPRKTGLFTITSVNCDILFIMLSCGRVA
jgi:hypothetical protein